MARVKCANARSARLRSRILAAVSSRTGEDGVASGTIRLSAARAEALLAAQRAANGWLRFRAATPGLTGAGVARLIPPEGLSVVSDIDDTVKVSGITEGSARVLRSTFFEPFEPVPGMAGRYRACGPSTAFHYVSGSPRPLFRPLRDGLTGSTPPFPDGSFHLLPLTLEVDSKLALKRLLAFVRDSDLDATVEHKIGVLTRLVGEDYPARRFVLVGDSGQHDREIYERIRERFGDRVVRIVIRDVADPGWDTAGVMVCGG